MVFPFFGQMMTNQTKQQKNISKKSSMIMKITMKFSQSFSHFCTIKFGNKELMSEQTAKQQNKTAKGQWESDWLNFGTVKQFDDDWMNEWMNEWTEFHYILFFLV